MSRRYKRPPVQEAVIEFRFSMPTTKASLQKVARQLKTRFPRNEEQNNFKFAIEATGPRSFPPEFHSLKLTSKDDSEILVLANNSFAKSLLPPYNTWEEFAGAAERDWLIAAKAYGAHQLSRIGVRFVNRIDIPQPTESPIDFLEFTTIFNALPNFGQAQLLNMTARVSTRLDDIDATCTINLSTVPSPLLDHASVILDIDVGKEANLPRTDSPELWTFLELLREAKNRVFEACITDRSRALFDQEL